MPIDLRQVVDNAAASCAKGSRRAEDTLDPSIRWLLSRYLVPVDEAYVQTALRDHLHIQPIGEEPCVFSGSTSARRSTEALPTAGRRLTVSSFDRSESSAIFADVQPFSASHKCTAQRLLVIVALCRVFLNFAGSLGHGTLSSA